MSNIEENDDGNNNGISTGKTIKDYENKPTVLIILKEFAKELDIKNSGVSLSLLKDFEGNEYPVVSKFHKEIAID